jgi:hypothetical protein
MSDKEGAALHFSNQSPYSPRSSQKYFGTAYPKRHWSIVAKPPFTMSRLFIVAKTSIGYSYAMDHCRDSNSQAEYGSISRRSSYLAGTVRNSPFGVVFEVFAIAASEHHACPPRNRFNRVLLPFTQVAGRNSLFASTSANVNSAIGCTPLAVIFS